MTQNESSAKRKISPRSMIWLVAALLCFILAGGGSAYAALTYFSPTYAAQLETYHIGVGITERYAQGDAPVLVKDTNGKEYKTLLTGLLENNGGDAQVIPGKKYNYFMATQNTGSADEDNQGLGVNAANEIDQYQRVVVNVYWLDPEGNKTADLDPSLVNLHFIAEQNGWFVVEEQTGKDNAEQTALVYSRIVKPGQDTPAFTDYIQLSKDVMGAEFLKQETSTEGNVTKTTTVFELNGYQLAIDAEVDAVQTHNAADAIKSAWGYDATLSDGVITSVSAG